MRAKSPRRTTDGKLAPSILGLALLCAALPCHGASRLEASLGFGGYSSPERWIPLWIRCVGLPAAATIRILRLSPEGRSLGAETFPILEGIRLECPIWMGGELETVSVRLLSGDGNRAGSGDRALAEVKLEARSKFFPGHIVLACGLSKDARLAIASSLMPLEPVLVIPTTGADLPSNGLDYDAVSAIAIADTGLELSPAQRTAILAWTAGGGRLCSTEASGAWGSKVPPGASVPYGLGAIVSLTTELSEKPRAWVEALSLAPYDPSIRTGAGTLARGPESAGAVTGAPSGLRGIIAIAIAAWLAATLLSVRLSRAAFAPVVAVSGLCLAAVLAGGPSLDKAFLRGASVRALSLVLPESGSAFLSVRARSYASSASLDWASARAIGPPSLAFGGTESGSFREWRHSLTSVALGLKSMSGGGIDLEGMLGPEEWRGISRGSASAFSASGESLPRGGTEPPDVDSSYPLAFLASGEPAAWWARSPGAPWAKSEAAPEWLAGDAQWLLALRGGRSEFSILAGSCPAGLLSLSVEGGRLREIRWAMPLPKGGGR